MEIKNNRIVGVDFRQSPNTSGLIKENAFLVLHDDFGHWEGTTSWMLDPKSKVSYHLYVSKTADVRQFVDLNKRAWHAGVSEWKGYKNLNDYSVGIACQNLNGEAYPKAQVDKVVELCLFLMKTMGFREVVRHRDIAPTRKTDTSNAFPWKEVSEKVNGIATATDKLVTTARVNLRQGPSVNYSAIETLNPGVAVHVIESSKDWTHVIVCSTGVKGWISSQYLK